MPKPGLLTISFCVSILFHAILLGALGISGFPRSAKPEAGTRGDNLVTLNLVAVPNEPVAPPMPVKVVAPSSVVTAGKTGCKNRWKSRLKKLFQSSRSSHRCCLNRNQLSPRCGQPSSLSRRPRRNRRRFRKRIFVAMRVQPSRARMRSRCKRSRRWRQNQIT